MLKVLQRNGFLKCIGKTITLFSYRKWKIQYIFNHNEKQILIDLLNNSACSVNIDLQQCMLYIH